MSKGGVPVLIAIFTGIPSGGERPYPMSLLMAGTEYMFKLGRHLNLGEICMPTCQPLRKLTMTQFFFFFFKPQYNLL